MNKNEFLSELRKKLAQLPESEIQKHIAYYDEMIADRIEDGMTEKEAVSSLEDVAVIAERILQDTSLPILVKTKVRPQKGWTATAIILAIIGSPIWLSLLLALGAVIAAVFCALWGVAVAAVGIVAAVVITGVLLLLSPFFMIGSGLPTALMCFGAGIGAIGIALLCVVGVKYLVKGIVWLCREIGKGIKSVFIRREI